MASPLRRTVMSPSAETLSTISADWERVVGLSRRDAHARPDPDDPSAALCDGQLS
jgi:hypothetical protein